MIKFNRQKMRDKINACWMGKNIGGTMGTPYEHTKEILDIKGFTTQPGEVLVNDDLDLQLVWLKAMEEVGPEMLNERILGEYWLSYIHPHWNEYGVAKSNMREGFFPPMSGEVNNDEWKHSNGAWIRTEIWACLFPGNPEKAIKYAYYDACVDHGFGEGTYAAIFVESMQSAAFIINDLKTLLDIGLSKIPEHCRVAKSVKLVMSEYDKGTPWKDVRNMIVKDCEDLGWFQAPANVAYVVLGMLYGECDFKKSMIYAINCGDDTDCTAATVGSTLGIMYGTECIPEDWKSYIGDKLMVGCLLHGHNPFPKTCCALTESVMALQNVTMFDPSCVWDAATYSTVYDGEDDFSAFDVKKFMGSDFAENIGKRKPYSFSADNVYAEATVELDSAPFVGSLGELTGTVSVKNIRMPEQKHFHLRWITENGFKVTGNMNLHTMEMHSSYTAPSRGTFTIHAPEYVPAKTRIILEITAKEHITPIYLPITILG